ncbi:MAG: hypothetical protein ACKO2K_02015, partial [Alphaproteobacteria bacterium]
MGAEPEASRLALDIAVSVGASSVRVESDCRSVVPWIRELLSPWIDSRPPPVEAAWTLHVSCDASRLADFRARRAEHATPQFCFAHDTRLQRLPARDDESGATVLADDERDAFLVVRPGRVDLCVDDARRRGRMFVPWTLAEIAATEFGADFLDLHASAVTT